MKDIRKRRALPASLWLQQHQNSIEGFACPMIWFLLQHPLTWFLRSVLVLPSFVGIMLPRAQTEDSFFTAYKFCVKASAPCQWLDSSLSRQTCGLPMQYKLMLRSLRTEAKVAFWTTGCMHCDVQVLGCWILFCAANVAKALIAKKMASHFHKQTHFQKMRDAIKKVRRFCLLATDSRLAVASC